MLYYLFSDYFSIMTRPQTVCIIQCNALVLSLYSKTWSVKHTYSKLLRRDIMASSKQIVVLITGCSTGIGLSTAVMLAKDANKRFKVYATMRNLGKKEALQTEGKDALGSMLIIKQLDICSEDQINKIVDGILAKEGKLDVLGRPNFLRLSIAHFNKHHCQERRYGAGGARWRYSRLSESVRLPYMDVGGLKI